MTSIEHDSVVVSQRHPDSEALWLLLEEAFDGWGSRAYFEWKYDQFPGYDPAAHNFVVTTPTGELVGARRVFERDLERPDGATLVAHVHGGTAVHPDHRGNGYYSELLDRSLSYSREQADCLFTFNRAGKITTDHHLKNGWRHVVLPVFAKVLSPSKVAAEYLFDTAAAGPLSDLLSTVDSGLTKSQAVSRLIALSADFAYGADTGGHETLAAAASNCEIQTVETLDEQTARNLSAFLASTTGRVHQFERSPDFLRHAALYPDAHAYLARSPSGTLLGFVIAGQLQKSGLTEFRVLEQAAADPGVMRALLERVEHDARDLGTDVVVTCSARRPSHSWVSLGTEYMMWPPEFSEAQLPRTADEWRITAQDIL